MQCTSACADCVVTFLLSDEHEHERAPNGRDLIVLDETRRAWSSCSGAAGHGASLAASRRPADRSPRTLGRWPRRIDAPDVGRDRRDRGRHDIDTLGVAPADVLDRARTALLRRKAAGLHAGMGFTYRNPERSTDPRAGGRRRPVDHRRRPAVPARRRARPPGRRPQAQVARYAWVDHYAPLRAGLRDDRPAHPPGRAPGGRVRRRQLDRRPRGRLPRPGSAGSARTPTSCCPGAGSFFVLGCVVTTADVPDRRAGRRRLRDAAAAASTAARPGRSSPPAWSTPTAAWRGSCRSRARSRSSSARRSATASTAATTARRCARRRCVSATASRRAVDAGDGDCRRRGSTCSTCSTPTTTC